MPSTLIFLYIFFLNLIVVYVHVEYSTYQFLWESEYVYSLFFYLSTNCISFVCEILKFRWKVLSRLLAILNLGMLREAAEKVLFFSCPASKRGWGGVRACLLRKKRTFFETFFFYFVPNLKRNIYIYIQGPHGNLGLKENLSHTLKNKVIILIFFCISWY